MGAQGSKSVVFVKPSSADNECGQTGHERPSQEMEGLTVGVSFYS